MSFESVLIRTIALMVISVVACKAKSWFHTGTVARSSIGTIESLALCGYAYGALATALAYHGYSLVLPMPFLWIGVFVFAAMWFYRSKNTMWQIIRSVLLFFYIPIFVVGYSAMAATDPFNTSTALLGVFAANFAINFAMKKFRNETYYPTYALLIALFRM